MQKCNFRTQDDRIVGIAAEKWDLRFHAPLLTDFRKHRCGGCKRGAVVKSRCRNWSRDPFDSPKIIAFVVGNNAVYMRLKSIVVTVRKPIRLHVPCGEPGSTLAEAILAVMLEGNHSKVDRPLIWLQGKLLEVLPRVIGPRIILTGRKPQIVAVEAKETWRFRPRC